MKMSQSQVLELDAQELVDAVKAGLKAKMGRKQLSKGIDSEEATVEFETNDESEVVGATVTLPAVAEDVKPKEKPIPVV